MYSRLEEFEEFEKASFNHNFYNYAIWKNNKLVSKGDYDTNISCGIRMINGVEVKNIIIFKNNLNNEIADFAVFDRYLSAKGTDLLLLLPESSDNKSIQMLSRITGGPTREQYIFEKKQPYCCRVDFEDGEASKLIFNLYEDNTIIEFF